MHKNRIITPIAILSIALLVGCNAGKTFIDEGSPFNPVEVTNPILNFKTNQVHIEGNYAYAIGGQNGMLAIDITDPKHPSQLAYILDDPYIREFAIADGYAFIIGYQYGLSIIELDSPQSGHLVSSLGDFRNASAIHIDADALYITQDSDLFILDISNPASPQIVGWVEKVYGYNNFDVHGGYAYFGDYETLTIVDIDPPGTAHIVTRLVVAGSVESVDVVGNYAYLAAYSDGLMIVDISNPQNPGMISTLELGGYAHDIQVSNGYAYIAADREGLQVVDVTSTAMPEIVASVEIPLYAQDLEISGDYAYVANGRNSLNVIDISSPQSPYLAAMLDTPVYCDDVEIHDGYAYALKSQDLCIVDVDPPDEALTVGTISLAPEYTDGFAMSERYVYIGCNYYDYDTNERYGKIEVIDIADPASPIVAKNHQMNLIPRTLALSGDYLHIVGSFYGDIDYPAYLIMDAATLTNVKSMQLGSTPNRIDVSNGYAYITCSDELHIVDVDPADSAHIVKTLNIRAGNAFDSGEADNSYSEADGIDLMEESGFSMPELEGAERTQSYTYDPPSNIDVVVSDRYAYVIYGSTGTLQIVDINPPESAHVIRTYDMPGSGTGICLSGDYLFATFSDIGLAIIDIDPPETCRLTDIFPSENETMGVQVVGEHAYLADSWAGLRIIDLR